MIHVFRRGLYKTIQGHYIVAYFVSLLITNELDNERRENINMSIFSKTRLLFKIIRANGGLIHSLFKLYRYVKSRIQIMIVI